MTSDASTHPVDELVTTSLRTRGKSILESVDKITFSNNDCNFDVD